MPSAAEMVREFHEAFGLVVRDAPTLPDADERELRATLIREEYAETWDELESGGSIERVASELADLIYVVYGTALHYGIDLDAVVAEIHAANMRKLGPCEKCKGTGRGKYWSDDSYAYGFDPCETCAGKGKYARRRPDGKILKPEGWESADVAGVLGL